MMEPPKPSYPEALEKLKQAETYINYQEFVLQGKENELVTAHGKIESLTHEVESKTQLVMQLNHQITTCNAELKKLKESTPVVSPSSSSLSSSKDLEELRAKLQQAADYVAYQNDQLAELNEEIDKLKAELTKKDEVILAKETAFLELQKTTKATAAPSVAIISSDPTFQKLKADYDEAIQKLAQAADYVKYQDDQIATKDDEIRHHNQLIASKDAEIKRLQDLVSDLQGNVKELQANAISQEEKKEMAKMKAQLQQAAEYVNFQTEQIAEKDAEIASLTEASHAKDKRISDLLIQLGNESQNKKDEEAIVGKVHEISEWNRLIQTKLTEIQEIYKKNHLKF